MWRLIFTIIPPPLHKNFISCPFGVPFREITMEKAMITKKGHVEGALGVTSVTMIVQKILSNRVVIE